MKNENVKRIVRSYTHKVNFPADKVFPLLCPVLEYDWIEGWECDLLYSETGVAENNCIFRTNLPHEGEATWVVSRYEPNKAIEFVTFCQDSFVKRLDLYLVESPAGVTNLTWTRTYTVIGPKGEAFIEYLTEEVFQNDIKLLAAMIDHYLQTGERMKLKNAQDHK